jgi:hypothetical protein
MNKPQRIVILIGCVALLIVLATTGAYQRGGDGIILKSNANGLYANLWDWQAALVRAGIVSIATAGVYLAVGKRKQ